MNTNPGRMEVQNLTLELRAPGEAAAPRRLVHNLSFTVEPGRALALVGESGAGKSLAALAIMRQLPPAVRQVSGTIRADNTAMILQNPMSALDPIFTVWSHFKEMKVTRPAAAAALREVGFPHPEEILKIYPFQMSGGMLQRTLIALALVKNPAFLIADEATTDLDPALQQQILSLLRERCRERGTGLLVITHDREVADFLADEIVELRRE